MTMRELNRELAGILAMAKDYKDMQDADIAEACSISVSNLRGKKSNRELPMLSFWCVAVIASLAGKRIEFVDERK